MSEKSILATEYKLCLTQKTFGHNKLTFSKFRTIEETRFYFSQTIENELGKKEE